MARLFPFRSEPAERERQPRVVDLEGEDADAVFGALSSTTARRIYARLDEEPGTPSDVADAVDSSIQNVRYHLEKLEDAGLVEVVDTWYSSRGNEMSVYATTDGPLIVTSDESTAGRLREALSRFVGGLAVLAAGSVMVQTGLTRWAESAVESERGGVAPASTDDGADDGDGGDETEGMETEAEAEDTDDADSADETAEEDAGDAVTTDGDGEPIETATDGGAEVAQTIFETAPPGLLFFLGGLVVLTAIVCYWYWYWYRPTY